MRQNGNEVKQKSELPAHEVSFVRLRKRVNILASNSPVAIFAPSRTPERSGRDWEKWKGI
jgi:hypothetical protein